MNNLVVVNNNQVVVCSRDLAEHFDKRHVEVLDKIRELLSVENSTNEFFHEQQYTYNGRTLPMYLMNRDGFALLAMGFTGKKALQWKLKYIEAFNEMEKQIQQGQIESPKRLKHKTFLGSPVMTVADLSKIIQIDAAYINRKLNDKKNGLQKRMLIGADIQQYKFENNIPQHVTIVKLLVFPSSTVYKLIKLVNRDNDLIKLAISQYFNEQPLQRAANVVKVDSPVCVDTKEVREHIATIEDHMELLKKMLNHLTGFKRTKEEQTYHSKLLTEIGFNVYDEVQALSKTVAKQLE